VPCRDDRAKASRPRPCRGLFVGGRWPPGHRALDLLALPWTRWHDTFDLWSNGLGYLPLGLLLFVAAVRAGRRGTTALLVAALGPSLLAYAAEVAQHLLPGRHPSLTDWALNAAGALGGALLGAVLHALGLVARWQGLRERWFARESAGALALLALWPVALLFPAPAPLGSACWRPAWWPIRWRLRARAAPCWRSARWRWARR
jgi:hypothetical protein